MSKISLLVAIVISSVFYSVRSEEGHCPKVKLMQNFKPEQVSFHEFADSFHHQGHFIQYTGRWYEIQRYPMFFEDENKCVMAEYTLKPNGTIGVHNMAVLES